MAGGDASLHQRNQQPAALCSLHLQQPVGLSAAQKGRVWVATALIQTNGQAWLLCSGFGGGRAA